MREDGDAMSHAERAAEPQGLRGGAEQAAAPAPRQPQDPCVRAENEDDDGYDPYSDRRPAPEPLFERDPWS